MPNRICIKDLPTAPLCSCAECDEERRAIMRLVFTMGVGEGPELDWDYELSGDSYTNAEHGE